MFHLTFCFVTIGDTYKHPIATLIITVCLWNVSIDRRSTNFPWIPRRCVRVPPPMLTPRNIPFLRVMITVLFHTHTYARHTIKRERGKKRETEIRTVANNLNNENGKRVGRIKMPFRRASRFRIYEITAGPVLAEFQFQRGWSLEIIPSLISLGAHRRFYCPAWHRCELHRYTDERARVYR